MLNSEELLDKVKGYNKFVNLDRLDKAYKFGLTPLYIASDNSHLKIVKVLIASGA